MLTVDIITLHDLAKLFMIYIFSKHGVLSYITSNHGTEFVSNFFRFLKMILNMKLHFTSRYHSKEDSQTEHTNQILEQYLHIYCNYQQDNQLDLFLFTEFAYNNTSSATTGMLPFFADKGYHSNITIVTNFIQLISLQPVDQFLQTKLCWKVQNEGYLCICRIYKSNKKQLRYQAISNCKSFIS